MLNLLKIFVWALFVFTVNGCQGKPQQADNQLGTVVGGTNAGNTVHDLCAITQYNPQQPSQCEDYWWTKRHSDSTLLKTPVDMSQCLKVDGTLQPNWTPATPIKINAFFHYGHVDSVRYKWWKGTPRENPRLNLVPVVVVQNKDNQQQRHYLVLKNNDQKSLTYYPACEADAFKQQGRHYPYNYTTLIIKGLRISNEAKEVFNDRFRKATSPIYLLTEAIRLTSLDEATTLGTILDSILYKLEREQPSNLLALMGIADKTVKFYPSGFITTTRRKKNRNKTIVITSLYSLLHVQATSHQIQYECLLPTKFLNVLDNKRTAIQVDDTKITVQRHRRIIWNTYPPSSGSSLKIPGFDPIDLATYCSPQYPKPPNLAAKIPLANYFPCTAQKGTGWEIVKKDNSCTLQVSYDQFDKKIRLSASQCITPTLDMVTKQQPISPGGCGEWNIAWPYSNLNFQTNPQNACTQQPGKLLCESKDSSPITLTIPGWEPIIINGSMDVDAIKAALRPQHGLVITIPFNDATSAENAAQTDPCTQVPQYRITQVTFGDNETPKSIGTDDTQFPSLKDANWQGDTAPTQLTLHLQQQQQPVNPNYRQKYDLKWPIDSSPVQLDQQLLSELTVGYPLQMPATQQEVKYSYDTILQIFANRNDCEQGQNPLYSTIYHSDILNKFATNLQANNKTISACSYARIVGSTDNKPRSLCTQAQLVTENQATHVQFVPKSLPKQACVGDKPGLIVLALSNKLQSTLRGLPSKLIQFFAPDDSQNIPNQKFDLVTISQGRTASKILDCSMLKQDGTVRKRLNNINFSAGGLQGLADLTMVVRQFEVTKNYVWVLYVTDSADILELNGKSPAPEALGGALVLALTNNPKVPLYVLSASEQACNVWKTQAHVTECQTVANDAFLKKIKKLFKSTVH